MRLCCTRLEEHGLGERGRLARSFRPPAENIHLCNGNPFYQGIGLRRPAGGTPTGATGTVALPVFSRIVQGERRALENDRMVDY